MPQAKHSEGLHLPSLFVVLLAALLAAAPLLLNTGFLNTRAGGDSPFLLFRLHQLHAALGEGAFPVRWMPDAAFGYGFPFFNFYAALPFYFAAGFKFLGFSYVVSLKLTQALGFLVAALGMYAWVKAISGRVWGATLASAAYTFAPFHMVNIYVRGDSLSEFWAMAWYPLILLSIYAASREASPRRLAAVALSYGALIMTHNVSALLFSPFVVIYALGCVLPQGIKPTLQLAGAGLLGLGLAAWVWLPALGETGFVQLDAQTTGFFFYGNHFRSSDLVQVGLMFDYTPTRNPFSMGLVQVVLTAGGAVGLVWRMWREATWWRDGFLLGGLLLSTVMITPLSDVLWSNLPLLPFAQFPWRFLSVQAVFAAAAIAALLDLLPYAAQNWQLEASITLIIAMSAASLAGLQPDFISITDADVTPRRLQLYEAFSGNIGTTIRYEYLPRWVAPRPYTSDVLLQREPRAKFMQGSGQAERISQTAHTQQWQVKVEEQATIGVPLYYYPGWRAESAGHPLPLTVMEGLGYVQLELPPGDHTIELRFGRTPLRWVADITALGAFIAVGVLWQPRIARRDVMWVTGGIMTLIVWVMVATTLPDPTPSDRPLTADFAQQAYFYPTAETTDLYYALRLDRSAQQFSAPLPQVVQGGLVTSSHDDLTPGLYFTRLDIDALTSTGEARGGIYTEPLIVRPSITQTDPTSTEEPITLLDYALEQDTLRLLWQPTVELPQNYQIGIRLYDSVGNEWAALDTQAGAAGAYPTGLWVPAQPVPDAYHLDLPAGMPASDQYTAQITLYEAATLTPVFTQQLTDLRYAERHPAPCDESPRPITDGLALRGSHIPERVTEGEALRVELEWVIDQPVAPRVVWALGEVWQVETALAPGWQPEIALFGSPCGQLILGRHVLDIPRDVPRGTYPLTATVDDQRLVLGDVTLEGRDRVFDLPPLEETVGAIFGGEIVLWGVDVTQTDDTLHLDIVWGATATPSQDYTAFVHVFDPETEVIVAQIDTMPRAFTYPTSLWVADEVVTETISLPLDEVPPGEYQIAIGWYTAEGRLPPISPEGQPHTDDRVLLDQRITVP